MTHVSNASQSPSSSLSASGSLDLFDEAMVLGRPSELQTKLSALRSELCCPICSRLMDDPLSVPGCFDTFCAECCRKGVADYHECPLGGCRQLVIPKELRPSPLIANIVKVVRVLESEAESGRLLHTYSQAQGPLSTQQQLVFHGTRTQHSSTGSAAGPSPTVLARSASLTRSTSEVGCADADFLRPQAVPVAATRSERSKSSSHGIKPAAKESTADGGRSVRNLRKAERPREFEQAVEGSVGEMRRGAEESGRSLRRGKAPRVTTRAEKPLRREKAARDAAKSEKRIRGARPVCTSALRKQDSPTGKRHSSRRSSVRVEAAACEKGKRTESRSSVRGTVASRWSGNASNPLRALAAAGMLEDGDAVSLPGDVVGQVDTIDCSIHTETATLASDVYGLRLPTSGALYSWKDVILCKLQLSFADLQSQERFWRAVRRSEVRTAARAAADVAVTKAASEWSRTVSRDSSGAAFRSGTPEGVVVRSPDCVPDSPRVEPLEWVSGSQDGDVDPDMLSPPRRMLAELRRCSSRGSLSCSARSDGVPPGGLQRLLDEGGWGAVRGTAMVSSGTSFPSVDLFAESPVLDCAAVGGAAESDVTQEIDLSVANAEFLAVGTVPAVSSSASTLDAIAERGAGVPLQVFPTPATVEIGSRRAGGSLDGACELSPPSPATPGRPEPVSIVLE